MVRWCGDAKSREQVRRFGRGANADRNLLPPKHQNCAGLTLVLTGAGPARKVVNHTGADEHPKLSRKHRRPCVRVQHVVRSAKVNAQC
jgi:hypothetical protein